ncbi:MAG: M28 family peptidase [Planctomycetota bacterium]
MNSARHLTRHLAPRLAMFLLAGGAALSCAPVLAQNAPASSSIESRHMPASDETRKADEFVYRQHVTTLSNPYFEGRCPGTRGNQDAAEYLEFYFKRYGLTPAFTHDGKPFSTFMQPFTPVGMRDGKTTIASQTVKLGDAALVPENDFRALGSSGNGTVTGPIVFVGYSVPDGENEYKSYEAQTSLKGKIALILRFEPMGDDGGSKWSEEGWSPRSALPAKIEAAAKRGAAAIIVVNPPGAKDTRAKRLATLAETAAKGEVLGIPAVMLSTDAADKLVRNADAKGRTLAELRKLADAKGEVIDLPNGTVTIQTELKREVVTTNNVGGILKGKGALADEYVVIGSHYDHVGYGDFGSLSNSRGTIHPGADDNASGTSGTLTLAKKFGEMYAKLPEGASCRSILFLGFSAEESGLEGSRFYCQHMIVPREKNYVMLNLDMIGRLRDAPPLEITGVGSAVGLEAWLQPYFDNAGFKTVAKKRAPSNSDHASFYNVKIPIAFFFTGLHGEYHRPADTVDLINIEGAAKVVDLVYRIATDATTRTEPLVFGEPKAPVAAVPAPEAPPATPPAAAPGGDTPVANAGGGVRFGIMPGDYADEKAGVLVGEVFPNTPAAKAGLKAGDRITKWNGTVVKDVEAWTPLLRGSKPGDKVEITYLRDSVEATCTVVLEARKEG